LITGGASGIGYAVAERFASDGATVIIFDINEKNCKLARDRFEENGWKKLHTFLVDVTKRSQVDDAMATVAKITTESLHSLVTSAAYFGSQGLNSTEDDWNKSLDVNLIGVSNVVQSCFPYLSKTEGASIVTISSISAKRAQRERWTYSATKGAIKTITKNLALDLSSSSIRVNCVSPGWIWSPEGAKASSDGTMTDMDKTVKKFTMIGRNGYTSEVAAAVTFLCSRDASYITGTNLMVDGGYTAMGPERLGEDSVFAGNKK